MRACKNLCVYQLNGVCTLDSTDAVGQPAFGGACLRPPITDGALLGSPHQYYAPGLAPVHSVSAVPPPGKLE